jgi:hypothetical protein
MFVDPSELADIPNHEAKDLNWMIDQLMDLLNSKVDIQNQCKILFVEIQNGDTGLE